MISQEVVDDSSDAASYSEVEVNGSNVDGDFPGEKPVPVSSTPRPIPMDKTPPKNGKNLCRLFLFLIIFLPIALVIGILVAASTEAGSSSSSSNSSTPQHSIVSVEFTSNRTSEGLVPLLSNLIYYQQDRIVLLEPSSGSLKVFSVEIEYWPNSMDDPFKIFTRQIHQGDIRFPQNGILSVSKPSASQSVSVCSEGYMGVLCDQCMFSKEIVFPDKIRDSSLKGPDVLDFSEALHKTLLNYNAFRSGDYSPRLFAWRDDSCHDCTGTFGEDLSGGHYEAGGSNLKIALPSCWTATQLAWNLIRFPGGFSNAQETAAALETIRWELEYWVKAHSAPRRFAAVFGDMNADFAYPGPPELYEVYMASRTGKVEYVTQSHPATEITGECAAAMAAGSIIFKDSDADFSQTLLEHATELFKWSNESRTSMNDSPNLTTHKYLYRSGSMYDELIWSAIWMYRVTGESKYLNTATELYFEHYEYDGAWGYAWDEKIAAIHVSLAELDVDCQRNHKYHVGAHEYFKQWLPNPEQTVPQTPKGLSYRDQWGSVKYAANTAFLGFAYAKLLREQNTGLQFASDLFKYSQSQIEYIMGSTGQSYIVGVGEQYPLRPYVQAAHYSFLDFHVPPGQPMWKVLKAFKNDPAPNTFTSVGYIVGGPKKTESGQLTDEYDDVRTDFVHGEGALDYNAGFIGSAAAILEFYQKGYPYSNCDIDLGWDHPDAGVRDVPCSFRY